MFDRIRQWRKYLTLLGALAAVFMPHKLAAELEPADVELVLAIDVSDSVDWQETELQRDGYIQVIESLEFVKVIKPGFLGKIAVTYIEWMVEGYQTEVVDWVIIRDLASAEAFAQSLKDTSIDTEPRTMIKDVIKYIALKILPIIIREHGEFWISPVMVPTIPAAWQTKPAMQRLNRV